MINELSRRRFLSQAGIGVSAAWVSAHWPEMVSAATHARQAVQSGTAYKFEFFTPAEATEIDALSARIIPTDDTPGAREAGVLYFIDRALVTFASGDQQKYRDGLPDLQSLVREKFPDVEKFSAATPEQQDELLHTMEASQTETEKAPRRRSVKSAQTFLEALRVQTIAGFSDRSRDRSRKSRRRRLEADWPRAGALFSAAVWLLRQGLSRLAARAENGG